MGSDKDWQRSSLQPPGRPWQGTCSISLAWALALGSVLGGIGLMLPEAALGLNLLTVAALMSMALRRMVALLVCLAGLWVLACLLQQQAARLPSGLAGVPLTVEGRVMASRQSDGLQRLTLKVGHCRPLEAGLPDCAGLERIRVSHYSPINVEAAGLPDAAGALSGGAAGTASATAPSMMAVGERWRIHVRLRPPGGLANPGRFDYRRWLWREGIHATGSVIAQPPPERLAAAPRDPRRALLRRLDVQPLHETTRRWLAALTLGRGERLDGDDWALLNATGTTHLAVVSGLHVGLVAALALTLSRLVARLIQPGRWRLVRWPWLAAAGATVGFVWLVGAEPPAMRALVMVLIALWVAGGRHSPSPWQGWALAWAVVVLRDPLALWRPGLWLSFGAVALLILMWQGRQVPSGLKGALAALLRTQLLLALPMAGLVLLAMGQVAPLAPLANLLAVPLVTLVLVPLGMLGWALSAVSFEAAMASWWLFEAGLEVMLALLGMLAELSPGLSLQEEGRWTLGILLLGLGALWLLPGLGARLRLGCVLSLVAAMLMLSTFNDRPGPGEVRLKVWDVGQGLMVELTTAGHRLLYDSGPRFRSGFAPLASIWASSQVFDEVIISHADQDHAGGLASLVRDHRVDHWWYPEGEPLALSPRALRHHCHAGEGWRWDGVDFTFLWPPDLADSDAGIDIAGHGRNDRSCVLLVTTAGGSALLTGDAGKRVERFLIPQLPQTPAVLVVGHHGSADSTGAALVTARPPRLAVISRGAYNGFGHPADQVVRRLRRAGSCLMDTAVDGRVTILLSQAGMEAAQGIHQRLTACGVEGPCHGVESRH